MRIVTMKHQATLQVLNEAVLASGTASGIWSEDREFGESGECAAAAKQEAAQSEH